jgi:hypothetical protein
MRLNRRVVDLVLELDEPSRASRWRRAAQRRGLLDRAAALRGRRMFMRLAFEG